MNNEMLHWTQYQALESLRDYQRKRAAELQTESTETELAAYNDDPALPQMLTEASMVPLESLPTVIAQQFEKIHELESKAEQAREAGEAAQKAAGRAYNMPTGWGQKKAAIEELQSSGKKTAVGLGKTNDAMRVSFECQAQLGKITQYLFLLGVSNIAATRTVVQQLRLQLQNAPKEKMSELARSEIMTVINQLQAQEDMANRQEKQSETLKKHEATLKEQNKHIASGEKKDAEQDRLISKMAAVDDAQNQLIEENSNKNEEQDVLIAQGIAKDAEQDQLLSQMAVDDAVQDALISENARKNEEQDDVLFVLNKTQNEQDELITQCIRKGEEHDRAFLQVEADNHAQDVLIAQNATKNDEQDMMIARGIEKDTEQDRCISRLFEAEKTQDGLIQQCISEGSENSKQIENLYSVCSKQGECIDVLTEENQQLKAQISALELLHNKTRKILLATSIGTATSTLLAILHFFI